MLISILTAAIATEEATPSSAVDFTWLFVKMVIVLGIVIVLALIVLKFLAPKFRGSEGDFFEVVGRTKLDAKKSLYLIRALKRYHIIGMSEHGISNIGEVSPEEMEGFLNEKK